MADNNSNATALEEQIRRCIRDEMRNFQGTRHGAQSLLDRTRTLIRGAAFSTARELERDSSSARGSSSSSSSRGSSSSSFSDPTGGSSKRTSDGSVPGHPYRPLRKKTCGKKAPATSIPKSVHLIEARSKLISDLSDDERDDLTEDSVLKFRENMVVVKGEFDLVTDHTEDQIRQELVDVFKTKLPSIAKSDFYFVKRDRQSILRPAVKAGHKWDFRHVKNLCGQGRLYLQLSIASEELAELNNTDNDYQLSTSPFDPPLPRNASGTSNGACSAASSSYGSSSSSATSTKASSSQRQQSLLKYTVNQVPPNPAGPSSISCSGTKEPESNNLSNSHIEELKTIFPGIPEYQLRSALEIYKSVPAAAEALTDFSGDIHVEQYDGSSSTLCIPDILDHPQSASDVLVKLRKQIELGSEKLKIDEEDVLSDILHYYKNPRFNPKNGLRICLKGKTAIDTGGVLRQVYTEVFSALAENKDGLILFKGDPRRKVPVFSNMHVLTGIFEVIGKVIAHSLIQDGPGFPYLAPVIYSYLSSGDLQSALLKASGMDVKDQPVSLYIEKIREAKETETDELNNDPEFVQMMEECGERRLLTVSNKLDVAQSLVTYNVLTKNVALLDQMRKGLSILGLLKEIEKYPHFFEHFFVHQGGKLTPSFVKELLKFCLTESEDHAAALRCSLLLTTFIDTCSEPELSDFLAFATGSQCETSSLMPGSIKVYFTSTSAIYASTCLMEIKIPTHFVIQEYFNMAMRAVIKGHSFNTH